MGELARVAEIVKDDPRDRRMRSRHRRGLLRRKGLRRRRSRHLEGVIDRLLPYARTNTSIIQSSPVARRSPRYA